MKCGWCSNVMLDKAYEGISAKKTLVLGELMNSRSNSGLDYNFARGKVVGMEIAFNVVKELLEELSNE